MISNSFLCFFSAASCLKSFRPNTIVLSGLSGRGKTTIYYQLRDGSSHQGTVTSMEENSNTFVLHSEQERVCKLLEFILFPTY
ncbi:signal recognition particle binding [Zea mays]|uniref:Signal recognition particle binding n=1 Tax=Zea mays TaxID=4577 RepID=A0A1D6FAU0_MAIZE|nr:signal recognition particle binding [Zea mays]